MTPSASCTSFSRTTWKRRKICRRNGARGSTRLIGRGVPSASATTLQGCPTGTRSSSTRNISRRRRSCGEGLLPRKTRATEICCPRMCDQTWFLEPARNPFDGGPGRTGNFADYLFGACDGLSGNRRDDRSAGGYTNRRAKDDWTGGDNIGAGARSRGHGLYV